MTKARDLAGFSTGSITNTTADGLILKGDGSSTDVVIKNGANATVATVADGTTTLAATANLTAGGSITATGASVGALARGSIQVGNSSGVAAAVAKGAADTVLTSDGTDISWAAPAAGGLTYASVSGPASDQTLADGAGGGGLGTIDWDDISAQGYIMAQTAVFTTGSDSKLVSFRMITDANITGNSKSGSGYIGGGFSVYRGIPSGTNTQVLVGTESAGNVLVYFTSGTISSFQNFLRSKTATVEETVCGANEVLWVLMHKNDNNNTQGNWTTSANAVSIESWS